MLQREKSQFADGVTDDFVQVCSDLNQVFQNGKILKDDKSTTVVRFKHNDSEYILKRFNSRNRWHSIKRALRTTRAETCWKMSFEFLKVGILVPKPIAKIEKIHGVFKGDSFFISEYIEGEELLTWLPQQPKATTDKVTERVREIFRTLNESLISHGDMKATNLLWFNHDLYCIDLDVAKVHLFKPLFLKAHLRDRKRFCRNGELFSQMLISNSRLKTE
jgi:tRNA A-37 threonylcarbamoyl transferase component Bud32